MFDRDKNDAFWGKKRPKWARPCWKFTGDKSPFGSRRVLVFLIMGCLMASLGISRISALNVCVSFENIRILTDSEGQKTAKEGRKGDFFSI